MNVNERVDDLERKMDQIANTVVKNYNNSVDLLSTKQLSSLINGLPYLPFTESSLRYSSIAYFLNDIVLNNRHVIVEFGSGISTIFLSKLLQQLNLSETFVLSIDSNQEWLNILKKYINIDTEGVNNIEFIHAELSNSALSLENNKWYNSEKLSVLEKYKGQVSCVLVDGPEAWNKEIELSRYPALPFIYDYLAEDCSVFLDDTERHGEKKILKMWSEAYGFKTEQLNSSFSRLYRGGSFNIM